MLVSQLVSVMEVNPGEPEVPASSQCCCVARQVDPRVAPLAAVSGQDAGGRSHREEGCKDEQGGAATCHLPELQRELAAVLSGCPL